MPSQKIVSLIASATEILCALGFRDQLVGRSHECDFPESVKILPICTKPKFDTEGSSLEIDKRVKQVLKQSYSSVETRVDPRSALSVYEVFADVLEGLQPSVIVTQSHCVVCAVSLRDVEQAVSKFVSSRPKIVSLEPNTLEDIWQGIERVAEALEASERGVQLLEGLRRRITDLSTRVKSFSSRPSVAYIEWIDPLMAGGNWMPELVELAGGKNVFGEAGKHSPWLSFDQLAAEDPEIILIAPCGFDIKRARQDLPLLTAKIEWGQLRAAKQNKVFILDGNQYFNRPGPRLVESIEILAEIIHPNEFHFGHEGIGWKRL
ncbi:MAG: cobalamin-binding protein [Candidatus Omnitrophica bacterium]|nr:cobalamin-binding protein [Candidatus Omnitrophota bacterium]